MPAGPAENKRAWFRTGLQGKPEHPFSTMHFLVVAYRWGALNAHQYHVGIRTDLDAAAQLAQAECSDRGGKYGVAVMEFGADDQAHRRAYFASTHGEVEPFVDHRLSMFSSIGHDVHQAVLTQLRWDPAEAGRSELMPHPVTVPTWLAGIVRKREASCRLEARGARDDAQHGDAAASRSRSTRTLQAWYTAASDAIGAELDELLAAAPARQQEILHAYRINHGWVPEPATASSHS